VARLKILTRGKKFLFSNNQSILSIILRFSLNPNWVYVSKISNRNLTILVNRPVSWNIWKYVSTVQFLNITDEHSPYKIAQSATSSCDLSVIIASGDWLVFALFTLDSDPWHRCIGDEIILHWCVSWRNKNVYILSFEGGLRREILFSWFF